METPETKSGLSITSCFPSQISSMNAWIDGQWTLTQPPIYLSCDVRHAGYKIGIVDTNLFPAGFNNLCQAYSRETANAFDHYLKTYFPLCKKILLFSESHTRNKFYLKNLVALSRLLGETREVVVGMAGLDCDLEVPLEPEILEIRRLEKLGTQIRAGDFVPDLILSNNDFSSGVPDILQNLDQPIIPEPRLGWQQRRKMDHFQALQSVVSDFAKTFELDPWRLMPITHLVGGVNLTEPQDLSRLATAVENLIQEISEKYQEYGITQSPYVYIKNDRGTYGLGLLPVFSGPEVLSLNRRQRNKLAASKGGVPVTDFLIQEGIPTIDSYSGMPLEPVIYAIGKKDIGGFFRLHELKNGLESLNAPGMSFSCLCLHKLEEPHEAQFLDCAAKEGVVLLARLLTRLAVLGVAREGMPLNP